jgi:Region found in RelA / SpoT proteins
VLTTRSQIDKLGVKLRRADVPDEALLDQLQAFRGTFDGPLAAAQEVVAATVGVSATGRIKTINTIVEKLVRSKTRLSTMQDIGGVRVVVDGGLQEQDAAVAQLCAAFAGSTVDDLRERTRHGYRAVHVIATIQGAVIEIQVRTRLQDLWAQGMEKLADRVGRGIRYGESPAVARIGNRDVSSILEFGRRLSDQGSKLEGVFLEISGAEVFLHRIESTVKDEGRRRGLEEMRVRLGSMRSTLGKQVDAIQESLAWFAEIAE